MSIKLIDIKKSKKDLIDELQILRKENRRLVCLDKEKKKIELALLERVKELNCLYNISHLVNKKGSTIEKILQGTVDLIPASWQYPEIISSNINYKNKKYSSSNFKPSFKILDQLNCEILVRHKKVGSLKIFYFKNRPDLNEEPFLEEEHNLIYLITERLGHIIERKISEKKLDNIKIELEHRVKERTRELRESENKFKTLSEKSMSGIAIIQKGVLKYVNPAFKQMFNFPKKVSENKFLKYVSSDDKSKMEEKLSKFENNKINHSHFQFKGKIETEKLLYLETYLSKIIFMDKPSIIGTFVNISERIKSENELKKKTAMLKEINSNLEDTINKEIQKRTEQERFVMQQKKLAAMGEMVGAIAHQWRQPLSTIGIIIQNLKLAHHLNKFDGEMLNKSTKDAMEQINYLSKTIDDFKKYYKPSKAKERFSVIKILKETASLMKISLENNYITFSGEYPSEDIKLFGFPNDLKQVVINIINNAKNAILTKRYKTPKKFTEGIIQIKVVIEISCLRIIIKNNGGKIPENIIERIFEPYFSTSDETTSTGIGLYMSKMIIENQMDGKLYVKNINNGVSFTIELLLDKNYNQELKESNGKN